MGVLARVIEAAGIATVGLSLIRRQAERIRAPRFLHCEFPLGRPLGVPGDPEFQTDVIRRAFALLGRTDVPVIEDHPLRIEDASDDAVACALPPRLDPSQHAAVDEAVGLRPAYLRQRERACGRTALGRVGGVEDIPALVERMVRLAEGASLADVGFDADSVRAAGHDIRAYYEEAAVALADHVPAARRIESWFYQSTRTGAVLRAASEALRAAGEERATWYFLLPANQA